MNGTPSALVRFYLWATLGVLRQKLRDALPIIVKAIVTNPGIGTAPVAALETAYAQIPASLWQNPSPRNKREVSKSRKRNRRPKVPRAIRYTI